jgi:adenylate kinase
MLTPPLHYHHHPRPSSAVVLQEPTTDGIPEIRAYHAKLAPLLEVLHGQHFSIPCPNGIAQHEHEILEQCVAFANLKKVSHAPRAFQIVVQGAPGSGKGAVAAFIHRSLGCVHVSPRHVILEQLSLGSEQGSKLKPFLEDPSQGKLCRLSCACHVLAGKGGRGDCSSSLTLTYPRFHLFRSPPPSTAPEEELAALLVQRLGAPDCLERGWVLEGYPSTARQASLLQDHGIHPNRCVREVEFAPHPPFLCI